MSCPKSCLQEIKALGWARAFEISSAVKEQVIRRSCMYSVSCKENMDGGDERSIVNIEGMTLYVVKSAEVARRPSDVW